MSIIVVYHKIHKSPTDGVSNQFVENCRAVRFVLFFISRYVDSLVEKYSTLIDVPLNFNLDL